MKDLNKPYENQLFDLLDGKLRDTDAALLRARIESTPALKSQYEAAKVIHQMLQSSTMAEPSLTFTDSVMSKLNDAPAIAPPSIWRGLFLLTCMLLAIGIAALLASQGVFDAPNTIVNLNKIDLPEQLSERTLPTLVINGKMIVKMIIFMNMIIGFFVLDRTILRPIFRRRAMA
jgi:hypothetical protein